MGRTSFVAKRLGTIGLAALVVGGVLLGSAVVAQAANPSGPTITVAPNTGLSNDPNAPSAVQMTGKGFPTGSPSKGGFAECSSAAGQPTVAVAGIGAVPVSCSDPLSNPGKVNSAGKIGLVGTAIGTGIQGPPGVGTDTSNHDAAADAANYPCPPFQSQVNAGATCEMTFFDAAGQSASAPISFVTNSTPDTTTTTTLPVGACSQAVAPATGTAAPGSGQGSVTVSPATCLVGGQKVTVTATGITPFNGTTNPLGTLLECNTDATQPTVTFVGNAIPVSCSGALAASFTPNAAGTLSTSFTVIVGTTGPPATGNDSAGNPGSADAPKYPCGPAADKCVIALGDLGGDKITVPISFNTNVALTNPATTTTLAGGTKAANANATKTSSGSLAFTGAGPGLWWLGLLGIVLIVLGGSTLVLVDGPRRLVRVSLDCATRLRRRTD